MNFGPAAIILKSSLNGLRSFSKQFLLVSYNSSKFLILLKHLKKKLFSDVLLKIKFLVDNKNPLRIKKTLFNPVNYTFNLSNYVTQKINLQKCKKLYTKNKQKKFIKKSKNYLKIFDCCGEFYLQI